MKKGALIVAIMVLFARMLIEEVLEGLNIAAFDCHIELGDPIVVGSVIDISSFTYDDLGGFICFPLIAA